MRDAQHLARLVHLGEITEPTVPNVEREAARDLARGREDTTRSTPTEALIRSTKRRPRRRVRSPHYPQYCRTSKRFMG